MLNYLKDLFISKTDEEEEEKKTHSLEIAACALLMEIANADENFSEEERIKIIDLMKTKFNLSEEEALNIISISEEEIEKSVSIYEFTNILNNQLNSDEKYSILKHLWRIAYADGNLDAYEDHYIKKISNNLHIYNQERIAAKLEVKEELGL